MYTKLIKNDIKKSKLITLTITAFILAAAMLTSLAASLIVNLLGAIDGIIVLAKSPHFMQMHTGDFDMEQLERFAASNSNVEELQVIEFLNIDGSQIIIEGNSLAWSVQDNGFSKQSKSFDFLLDLNSEVVEPKDGEIYIPIYYMRGADISVGDTVTIRGVTFSVAGFIRDAQMNAALVSSKRFLVSENDFESIKSFGIMENLIEFRLKDFSAASAFETQYLQAGMPNNGPPAITYALIKTINAITDAIMIAVLVLISLLVIIVAFLCIRFTLIAKMEEDYKEIGVLKAVGFRVSHLKKLYLAKYGAIAGVASLLGFLASLAVQEPFMQNIRLYMGESNSGALGMLFGAIGAATIFAVVMLYVSGILRRFKKISAAQAIRFGAPQEKVKAVKRFTLSNNRLFTRNAFLSFKDVLSRKKLYVTMLMVLVICSFIMIVPQNIYNTISDRNFVTHMGIGLCDMQLDIQRTQTDNVPGKTAKIAKALESDKAVASYTVLTSMMFDMKMEDGTIQRLKVDVGDHSVFPVTYSKGGVPQTEDEIAISTMNAEEMGKSVGDEIVLLIDGEEKRLVICGLYSDITNGGKTTKALFGVYEKYILGSSIPMAFYDSSQTGQKVIEYRNSFPFAKVSSIDEHIEQMFGSVINSVKIVSYASIAATILLTMLVTLLFMKMLVTKDRYTVAILKSLGFTALDIRRQYLTRAIIVLVIGMCIGVTLANTLGEFVGAALISYFGASTFRFKVDPLFAYIFSPLIVTACVYIAAQFGIMDIRALKVAEHIKE